MFDFIKSLIGYRCAKLSKDKISPISPPFVKGGTSQDPVPLKNKADIITEPPAPAYSTNPTPAAPCQDEDESFKIPGPKIWEIPPDSPIVFERVEDTGKYMKRCHDCLERKGEGKSSWGVGMGFVRSVLRGVRDVDGVLVVG